MKKLSYLIKYGLKKRLFTKAFNISSLIIGIIIIGITLLPSIISTFSDGKGEMIDDQITIVNMTGYDSGDTNLAASIINSSNPVLNALGYEGNVVFNVSTNAAHIPSVSYYNESHEAKGLIYMYLEEVTAGNPANDDNYLVRVEIYNQGINQTLLQIIESQLVDLQRTKYKFDHPTFDEDLISDLIPNFIADPTYVESTNGDMLAAIAPMLIIPMFMVIIIGLQFIGTEIMEEKSTKAIEIIIASVPPRTHFFAKIISIMLFLIAQLGVYVIFGMIGYGLNELIAGVGANSSGNWSVTLGVLAPVVLPTLILTLACSLLGALLYCVLGAFIASLAVNQEDYQSIQTPVMMILMFAYMGGIFAGAAQLDEFLLVLSFIPFTAPLVLPVVFAMGYIGILEVIIGLVILVVSIILLIVLFTPLYRASILSYDQSSLIKRIKNTFKTAKVMKENQKLYEEKHLE